MKEQCNRCQFCRNTSKPETFGRGSRNSRIMFIQDSVTDAESTKGIQFWGKSCDQLRKHLTEREIDTSSIYWTSVLKCPLPDEFYKPTTKETKECVETLFGEIAVVNPDIIIPMGNLALKYTANMPSITKVRGNAQEVTLEGKKRIVLPMIHPRQALKKPIYKELILKDLDTLKNLYESGFTGVSDVEYRSLETVEEVLTEVKRLRKSEWISFDLETTGKSPYRKDSKIVCISLTDKPHRGVVIPLYHRETPFTTPELGTIVKVLRLLLEDDSIKKLAQNGKFDIEWLDSWLDIKVANFCFDTMLAHHIAISEEQGSQGLKSMAWEFTDMGGYDNALDEYKNSLPDSIKHNYDNIPWSILSTYAVADVDCAFRLKDIFYPMIMENPKWKVLMSDFLMPASYALKKVEQDGMMISDELTDKYQKTYEQEIQRIKNLLEAYPEVIEIERERENKYREREQIALIKKSDRTEEEQKKFEDYKKYKDPKFSWTSPNQLKELLYERLGLTSTVRTDKGELSTSEDALIEMSEQHELPLLMMEMRKVTTLNNMFIKKLPEMRDEKGLIHSSYNPAGTVTGRLSSENPNFQQMPRKAEVPTLFQYHNEPKSLFVSRFGKNGVVANLDYSQLELRVAGIISGDEILEGIYKSGIDLHIATASKTFKVPESEVTKDQRTLAKGVGFGIIYGKSGVTFGREMYLHKLFLEAGDLKGDGKSLKENVRKKIEKKAIELGFKIVDDYLAAYPQLAQWLEDTKEFAIENGYVETMLGRRRRLPDLYSSIPRLKEDALRQAINAPIQGTGSDMTLRSIIEIQNFLSDKRSVICGTVHDSIVFDIYLPELSEVALGSKKIMENVHKPYIKTEVPILAEIEIGDSYGGVFEVTADEISKFNSHNDYFDWLHVQKLGKYKKEAKYLCEKQGFDKESTLNWMIENNRPLSEIKVMIDEIYSEIA